MKLYTVCVIFILIAVSMFHTYGVMFHESLELITPNYFERLSTNLFGKSPNIELDALNPEIHFNKQITSIYESKLTHDVENKYWLTNTDIYNNELTLNIPAYFYHESTPVPELQPFDPRFTIGVYYNWLYTHYKNNEVVEVPFHWYDWVDMSALNKYLLALPHEKLDCTFMDVRDVEKGMEEEKARKKQEEEERKKQEELEKQKQQQLKEEEERKKLEEENKKQMEQLEKEQPKEQPQEQPIEPAQEQSQGQPQGQPQEPGQGQPQAQSQDQPKEQIQIQVQEQPKEPVQEQPQEPGQEQPQEQSKEQTQLQIQEQPKGQEETQEPAQQNPKEQNQEQTQEQPKELLEQAQQQASPDAEQPPVQKVRRGAAHNPESFCINDNDLPYDHEDGNTLHPGFNGIRPYGRTLRDKALLLGKSYLYTFAPSPSSIIFLTKDGSYSMNVNRRQKLLQSNMVANYLKETRKTRINPLDEYNRMIKKYPPKNAAVLNSPQIQLTESSFMVNFKGLILEYELKIKSGTPLTKKELKYYQSLKYSENTLQNGGPPKYFAEARLLDTLNGDHYDWRFFNGLKQGNYEQTLTLHRLIRSFLSFCRQHGIVTWVAHGSLLSWYWNGMAFPWDNDIDVQMPILDLHKLSLNFNQSLVVEDILDGFGRYFLDCGSFITLRERGNGNNIIDARYTDVDTGLYIDITGLSLSNAAAPERYHKTLPKKYDLNGKEPLVNNIAMNVYNCRNNHFSSLSELSPLLKTNVEGEIGYVPKKFSQILSTEYSRGLLNKRFSGHVFVPQLRLWLKEDDLAYFLGDQEKWKNYHSFNDDYISTIDSNSEEDYIYTLTGYKEGMKTKSKAIQAAMLAIQNLNYTELLGLLSKDELLIQYVTTRDFTSFHEGEMLELLLGRPKEKSKHSSSFRPLKYDPFLFNIRNNYINYDEQVAKYLELMRSYKVNGQAHLTAAKAAGNSFIDES